MSYFDDNEDRIIYGGDRIAKQIARAQANERRKVTCPTCGKRNLRVGPRGRLYTPEGKAHHCPVSADDFDDLTAGD